ncbi:unnamed protein product [Symbiodinium sp. CCMP2592]|nr:unnamed protein product [Symbiodinium sp. CCMP2592]
MYEDGLHPETLMESSVHRLGIPSVADSTQLARWPSLAGLADLMVLRGSSRSSRFIAAEWISCWMESVEQVPIMRRNWVDSIVYEQLASRLSSLSAQPTTPQEMVYVGNKPSQRLPCAPKISLLLLSLRPRAHKYVVLGKQDLHRHGHCLGVVKLHGFGMACLNGEYTEQPSMFKCYDRPTYWSDSRCTFLYYHAPSKSWTLAPWDAWADVKIFGDGLLFAHSAAHVGIKDSFQEWYEFDKTLKTLRRVAAKHCTREVEVESRSQNLLSTLPRAAEVLKTMEHRQASKPTHIDVTKLLGVCQILQDMPTDGGWLAKQMENTWALRGLDLQFALVCRDALSRTLHLQRQRAREEELSRTAAEELIAEEERLQKARSKRGKTPQRQSHLFGCPSSFPEPPREEDLALEDGIGTSRCRSDSLLERWWCGSGVEDISELVCKLRHNFPMYDDDIIGDHLLQAGNDLERAVLSLSALGAEPTSSIVPADIPCNRPERLRSGRPKKIIANVLARTDHSRSPLFCFILLATVSESEKYKAGCIVRPIPEDRFRLLGDEKGHFWKRMPQALPEVGHVVEILFFEEDTVDYLQAAHGNYPHQNEDLLCTSLVLRKRCSLHKNVSVREALTGLAVDHVEERWPWGRGLGKFESVQPGKYIWYVPARKKRLPSVLILRQHRPGEVFFKYRNDSSDKISVDFPAGRRRRLSDVAVTAAGFCSSPSELNAKFQQKMTSVEFLFVLGLARAERSGPIGFNRLAECSEAHQRRLNPEEYEEYCQILLIGIIELPKVQDLVFTAHEDHANATASIRHAAIG